MRQKTLLKTMLLLCALVAGSGSVWADDSYTITFANSANSATGISSSTQASTVIAAASRGYVTSQPFTINSGNCYYGDTQSCIRIGKSGNASSLTIALSDAGKVSASTIVVNCNNTGGTKNSDATLSVNGKTAQTTSEDADDYSFTINSDIESITLAGSASIKIYSITVNYSSDDRTAVSINSLTFTPNYVTVGGATSTATAGHNTPACTTATFTYESLDPDKATCTPGGVITAVAKGTARIKATMSIPNNDPNYRVGTATITQTIEVKKAFHTATFYVNGVVDSSVDFEEDADVDFPSDPAALGGKVFKGWSTTAIDGNQNDAPGGLVTSATMGTSNITYYAVFAREMVNEASATKSYGWEDADDGTAWTITDAITKTSGQGNTGTNAGMINTNNTYVQFKEKVKVKSFSFAFKRTSNNTNYNVYIETSTDGSSWTANETYPMGDFGNGSYTSKTKTFDGTTELYVRFHCYNTTAVRYVDDVTIEYDYKATTYTDYCTTIPSTVPATLNASGYATFASTYPLDFTDDSEFSAWQITGVTGDAITFEQITSTVAAGTGVLLKGTASTDINIPVANSGSDISNTNKLEGFIAATDITADQYYGLKGDTFVPVSAGEVPAGKALLPASIVDATTSRLVFVFEGTQGISHVEDGRQLIDDAVYNLNGQRVDSPKKGLYIMNGKKVLMKQDLKRITVMIIIMIIMGQLW